MKSLDRRTLLLVAAVLIVGLLSSRFGGDDVADTADPAVTESAPTTEGSVLVISTTLFATGGDTTDTAGDDTGSTTSVAVAHPPTILEPQLLVSPISNLPTVTIDALPPEAIDTLWLIDGGGPYPFDRDDLTFQNREAILPDRQRGHYAEYTVITPGSPDRGARRIVAGDDGERYYTSDHYASFVEVIASEGS